MQTNTQPAFYRPTYTANPVADAARHYDHEADRGDAVEQAQLAVAEEIRAVFRSMVGIPYLDMLALPYTDAGGWKESRQKLDDAVADMICEADPFAALQGLLRARPGQELVWLEILRETLARHYVDRQANEVGSLRVALGGRA